jgi:hypothetical protein
MEPVTCPAAPWKVRRMDMGAKYMARTREGEVRSEE